MDTQISSRWFVDIHISNFKRKERLWRISTGHITGDGSVKSAGFDKWRMLSETVNNIFIEGTISQKNAIASAVKITSNGKERL